ncbi:uncharacterized protein [Gossypium hirsutum]|uniref:Uncharacterized protein isoform X2 n=1 Tax=Gossypium hirsutum TaxID=3635 RepID=A0ABM2Z9D4_GOSHI|nr:uncharacterized protein LOC107947636 isoform X2 [Gossypium hirsutum]
MQRRSNRPSPLPVASPAPEDNHSPLKSIIFNKRKRTIAANASRSTPASAFFNLQSSPPNHKTLTTISDLKEFVSSRLEDIKHNLIDRSHSEILKDLDASHSRLHKRFKTQACQQAIEEAEKEYKKILEKIDESHEAMKASYAEFMADAQATASRVCKTSISELSKSFEKRIDDLRSQFGMPSA